MFTGIIEEKGAVASLEMGAADGKGARIKIRAQKILQGTKVGDSIAVNGVCLTATSLGADFFTADVMAETLRRSNLVSLAVGSQVNLERAMAADGRFGGHIVSGHIDGTGTIEKLEREGNAVWVCVSASDSVLNLIVEKGSIAIDGISLTVAKLEAGRFAVSVIPHTGEETTLLDKKAGDKVNLENDIVGKYVQRLLGLAGNFGGGYRSGESDSSAITEEFLRERGF